MDMYVAEDGLVGDFHLVHLGGKALGGAGLVMTEMVCVSPTGRITLGCAGIWDEEQQAAWARIVDFVHASSPAKIGLQLGHSGAKGSTKLMWEGIDEPLPDGNWDVVAASPVSYNPTVNQVPHELTVDELDEIRHQFVDCARRGAEAGFDVLELHCAHGYLLSGFLSPVTNRRTDAYGGDIEGRLRWPLEVFGAMRAVWPAERPMTVRISATDWVDDGQTLDDAVRVAQAFADKGAAAIDVSTGQVTSANVRRSAARTRRRTPTRSATARRPHDRGRGDLVVRRRELDPDGRPRGLCALGRVHLYDPSWTLHAALDQDYDGPAVAWPLPWQAGKRKPQTGRSDGPKPRLQLIREGTTGTRHRRWRPSARAVGASRPRVVHRSSRRPVSSGRIDLDTPGS